MDKNKRWHFALIISVIALTIYNILPTVFYYTKPLKSPVSQEMASQIAQDALKRINNLKEDSHAWIKSFCKLLQIKNFSIQPDPSQPAFFQVSFKTTSDADLFRAHLPRAGSLIPFVPAQLNLATTTHDETEAKTVTVSRKISIDFDPKKSSEVFLFTEKLTQNQTVTSLYETILVDRVSNLTSCIAGQSENAQLMDAAFATDDPANSEEFLLALSSNILSYHKIFGDKSPIAKRYYASFTQGAFKDKKAAINTLIADLDKLKDRIRLEKIALTEREKTLKDQNSFLETAEQQKLTLLQERESQLTTTTSIIKDNLSVFCSGSKLPSSDEIITKFNLGSTEDNLIKNISLSGFNPLIENIVVNIRDQKITLQLYKDVVKLQDTIDRSKKSFQKDQLERLIFNEMARISRNSQEHLSPYGNEYIVELSSIPNSTSLLVMDLGLIAEKETLNLAQYLEKNWHPKHPDLARVNFPIFDGKVYQNLPSSEKKLGLVVFSPTLIKETPQGFRSNSIYIIAKGIDQILKKFEANPDSPQAKLFIDDFNQLRSLLTNKGFYGFPGSMYPFSSQYAKDFIFESEDYYSPILKATREDFLVHGSNKYAILELSNLEQRIQAVNRIETRIHEDLLKWRDEYHAAQVDLSLKARLDVPHPTKNAFVNNFILSTKKYFRGDERKILHWGLDLSGGKTVQIELRDQNNRKVTNQNDIQQGINELYSRVNKMGVSEVTIRQESANITLDFPGAQGLSASDLVKASSMYFHVVNEKFSSNNKDITDSVNRFLQDVWNEAIVTNRKDVDSINRIAWKHLYGDSLDSEAIQPRSDAAKRLYDLGLRLTLPDETIISSTFNDTYSKIAILRGNNFSEWGGQTHPLMIVFSNYALEGSNLQNVHASYDPSRGNFLGFEVKSSQILSDGSKINPRAELYAWTSTYSKEKISGTPAENYSRGRGWRMAVVLNGSVISSPGLESALKDSAMITGSFTQREVNKLEADLKAGSLTFAPHILSEKNVSPELGIKERYQGILATVVALALVIATMVGYYRFAGLIASIAVIFNLLIMWATLQNIQATITLAGIAGIILTVGMAVDANVLVFERIREEFAVCGRIATAIHAGYKKAFSAILDSNITTIIAALILLHFDSGPIKGFAVTLIIGIVSSMFTALFMTRFFFSRWVQNPQHKSLKMASFIKSQHFNFIKYAKPTIVISVFIILLGGTLLVKQKSSIFGMDFTGGFSLSLEVSPSENTHDYRSLVEKALIKKGLNSREFQVRELSPANNVRIFLSKSLEEKGQPFFGLPLEIEGDFAYEYQSNPRLVWIVQALQDEGLTLTSDSNADLVTNWTNISGQISKTMRNQATLGLLLALACILVYITFRFEFKYAVSATLGLAHDVLITIGFIGILHALKVPVQIDLNTIAAIMTIVGYSLNDTIIVFDRIREDVRRERKLSFKDLINNSLNITLSRTFLTSFTTLVVLIALVCLGGSTIFGFALVMTIGVVVGTLSSLFVAAPLLLFFEKRTSATAIKRPDIEGNQQI